MMNEDFLRLPLLYFYGKKASLHLLSNPAKKSCFFMKPRFSASSNVARGVNSQKPALTPATSFYYDAAVEPSTKGETATSSGVAKTAQSATAWHEEIPITPSPFHPNTHPFNRPIHQKVGRVHVGLPAQSPTVDKRKRSHQQRHTQQKKRTQRLLILLSGVLLAGGLLISGLLQLGQWVTHQTATQQSVLVERPIPASFGGFSSLATHSGVFKGEPVNAPSLRANQTTLFGVDSWLNPALNWPYERVALAPLPPLALPSETVNGTLQAYLDSSALQLGSSFRPHVLFYDPFSNTHAELNAQEPVPSASVIKLPLLYLYGLRLASGVNQPTDSLLLEERHRVEGSGIWIGKPEHSRFTLGETAANMIQTSDNVATEMMLEALGGVDRVNQQWNALGYASTRVRNQLPDKAGLNTISMVEMVQTLMGIQHHGVFQSTQVSGYLMDILEKTHNRRLIPSLLPKGTRVFHKTGDIGKSLGESAMVQLPDGRYYYLAMMVERPHNNGQAADFIRLFSKRVFDYQVAHKMVRNGALMASVASAGAGVPVDSSGVIATALPVPSAEAVEVF